MSDKATWMTSAQLWSQASEGTKQQQQPTITSPKEADIGFNVSPKLVLENKHRNGGGAFLPFSKDRSSSSCQGSSAMRGGLPELALASAEKEMDDKKCAEAEKGHKRENSSGNNDGVVVDQGKGNSPVASSHAQPTTTTTTTTHRKARRCWSPDLHRRFVNALQMLGGSQGIYIKI